MDARQVGAGVSLVLTGGTLLSAPRALGDLPAAVLVVAAVAVAAWTLVGDAGDV